MSQDYTKPARRTHGQKDDWLVGVCFELRHIIVYIWEVEIEYDTSTAIIYLSCGVLAEWLTVHLRYTDKGESVAALNIDIHLCMMPTTDSRRPCPVLMIGDNPSNRRSGQPPHGLFWLKRRRSYASRSLLLHAAS